MIRFFLISMLFITSWHNSNAQELNPKYEFRGVWVATVNNIDWPSKKGLSIQEQKKEAIELLDMMQEHRMNAVIFQARPCSDAFYKSNIEPWSQYLTGSPGKDPGYDPMAFWIDESHKRGLEFHAWINPFRIAQNANEELSVNSVAFQHKDWVVNYGNKLYLNPALEESRNYIAEVVRDIVSRYDIDAIHMDDYFYPYPVAGVDFPDDEQFYANRQGFAIENKGDWRRRQVDEIISLLGKTIKEAKPNVKFGISPFGVWRNKDMDAAGSNTYAGVTNYDDLYADVPRWLRNGWVDYLSPQIYWEVGHSAANYKTLIDWWSKHAYQRSIYVGHALYKIDKKSSSKAWKDGNEIPRQILLTRTTANIQGSIFYSASHFKRDLIGLQGKLKNQLYSHTALVPPMRWIDNQPPSKVQNLKARGKKLQWDKPEYKNPEDEPIRYIVYVNEDGSALNTNSANSIYTITTETEVRLNMPDKRGKQRYHFRVSALDALNNESEISETVDIKL